MLRRDLEAAGIPYEVGDKFADFHALRHTFITNLVRAGVPPKIVQILARHSSIELTMNTYTLLGLTEVFEAINRLSPILGSVDVAPDVAPAIVMQEQETAQIGTTEVPEPGEADLDERSCLETESLSQSGPDTSCQGTSSDVSGGGGIRTHGTAKRYTGFRDRPFQPLRHPSGLVLPCPFSLGNPRRSWKNRLRISPHSRSSTPAATSER